MRRVLLVVAGAVAVLLVWQPWRKLVKQAKTNGATAERAPYTPPFRTQSTSQSGNTDAALGATTAGFAASTGTAIDDTMIADMDSGSPSDDLTSGFDDSTIGAGQESLDTDTGSNAPDSSGEPLGTNSSIGSLDIANESVATDAGSTSPETSSDSTENDTSVLDADSDSPGSDDDSTTNNSSIGMVDISNESVDMDASSDSLGDSNDLLETDSEQLNTNDSITSEAELNDLFASEDDTTSTQDDITSGDGDLLELNTYTLAPDTISESTSDKAARETSGVDTTGTAGEVSEVSEEDTTLIDLGDFEAPAQPDDLIVIEGIGPKISTILTAAGFTSFTQIAEADPEHITGILRDAKITTANPSTWPQQAALAAEGKWDALRELQDRIKNGRMIS